MLAEDGAVVAPPTVPPHAWALSLVERHPLVLSAASERGWFGGRSIVAWSPRTLERCSLAAAAEVLEATRSACPDPPTLAVALLPYEGECLAATYSGGLLLTAEGWRTWGDTGPEDVPAPLSAAEIDAIVPPKDLPLAEDIERDMDARSFHAAVRSVQDSIAAGDVYVLNLTYRLAGRPVVSPAVAFAALADRARAEMGAVWIAPDSALVSASPERFLRVHDGTAEIHPIKGTRPRGADAASDDALAAELLASEKERAEHVMIVDLERNDLGRVSVPGSVKVEPLFEVVRTPYCHQLVSRVVGTLRPEVTVPQLLDATFPCGSVTGAPKIAAMRHIARLERSLRGTYTGTLAVAVPGEMDSSVLIRSAEYTGAGVRWGTGGGITSDSVPEEEWVETLLKASPLVGDGHPQTALRETCRVVDGRLPLWERHLARLAAGGCGSGLLRYVTQVAERAARTRRQIPYARLTVTVNPDGTVSAKCDSRPSVLAVEGGPLVVPVHVQAPAILPSGAAKPEDRGFWNDAHARAAQNGGDQAVLFDDDGWVIDGSTASVWAAIDGKIATPPAPPAVAGVARGWLLDNARDLGLEVEERPIRLSELDGAEEVFLTSALGGAVAASGRGGPRSAAISAAFRALWSM